MLKEVSSVLDMLAEVYEVFGLTYKLALSTRPRATWAPWRCGTGQRPLSRTPSTTQA